MVKSSLTPFVYSSVSDYLRMVRQNYGNHKKSISLKVWSQRLGYKTSRSLEQVISGKRLPSQQMAFQITQDLKLTAKEQQYFILLVQREKLIQKKKPVQVLDQRMSELRPRSLQIQYINNEISRRVSEWYPIVLRELRMTPGFRNDVSWIQKRLRNKVTSSQIATALAEWEGLTLKELVYTPEDVPSEALRVFHKKMLHKAIESIDELPVTDREFISFTFRSSARNIDKMKAVLREIRDRLALEFDEVSGDEVFQLNVVLFPHTKLKR